MFINLNKINQICFAEIFSDGYVQKLSNKTNRYARSRVSRQSTNLCCGEGHQLINDILKYSKS